MKPAFVYGLIILALTIATLLHAGKFDRNYEGTEIVRLALQDVLQYLPPDRPLKMMLGQAPGEVFLQSRLALAPRRIMLTREPGTGDTILAITGIQEGAPAFPAVPLWSHIDSMYRYHLLIAR